MTRLFLCCIAVTALLGSCEWIADIPERTQLTEPCDRYCQQAMKLCTGEYQLFHGAMDCASTCALYSSEDLKCREDELDQLEMSNANEAPTYCANASPSGGTKKCGGSACVNYCKGMGQVCADHGESGVTYLNSDGSANDDCVKQCSVIPDHAKTGGTSSDSAFDVTKDHEGDSIQCRLVHLELASQSATLASDHCPHAYINPQPINNFVPWCSAPKDATAPRCQDYCAVIMASCTDNDDEKHEVYENLSECMGACGAMDPGDLKKFDTSNTVTCRKNHAYNAAVYNSPSSHCPHAGPGGAGVCGDDCDSLCNFIEKGCDAQWQSKYMGKAKACKDECDAARKADSSWENGANYSVAAAKSGEKFACRLYHAAQAQSQSNDNKDACDIAAGIRSCPFPSK